MDAAYLLNMIGALFIGIGIGLFASDWFPKRR